MEILEALQETVEHIKLWINANKADKTVIGNLSNLKTSKKTDLVDAINETYSNKAPAGFGYGEPLEIVTASSTETYNEYCAKIDAILAEMPDNTAKLIRIAPPYDQAPDVPPSIALLYKYVDKFASVTALGEYGMNSYRWRLSKKIGIWFPLEWIDLPMMNDTEYRTTERINGETVFKKLDSASGAFLYSLDGETWNKYNALMGAAPAGFGYGGPMTYVNLESEAYSGMTLDTALDAVMATMSSSSAAQIQCYEPEGEMTSKYIGYLWKYTPNYATLLSVCYGGQIRLKRRIKDDGWLPWEWVNPSLVDDTEYRTTERINGSVVYKKRDSASGEILYKLGSTGAWTKYNTLMGAAPGDFGLGNVVDIKAEDLNSTFGNGWYRIANQSLTIGGHTASDWHVHVKRYSSKYIIQELYPIFHPYKLIRWCVNGTWTEEWENPPMVAGVEYRTTERWDGKAVYIKRVNLGTLPASGQKTTGYCPGGSTNVRFEAYTITSSGNVSPLPHITSTGVINASVYASEYNIVVCAMKDVSTSTGFAIVRYTKD